MNTTANPVDDQLIAAVAETTVRHQAAAAAAIGAAAGRYSEAHPAEPLITTTLTAQLRAGVVGRCEHAAGGPRPVWWSPGHRNLACESCWRQARHQDHPAACDCCSTAVTPGHGQMMYAAGPVTIVATLCGRCVERPAPVMFFDPDAPAAPDRHARALERLAAALVDLYAAS